MANTVLKICSRNSLTLYDIGRIIYRPDYEDTPSKLESIIEKTDNIYALISNMNQSSIKSEIEVKINKPVVKGKMTLLCDNNFNSMIFNNEHKLKRISDVDQIDLKEKNMKFKGELETKEQGENIGDNEKNNHDKSNILINLNIKSKKELESDEEKEEDSKRNKKRCSLLKRTQSEPKLLKVCLLYIQIESIEVVDDLNIEDKKTLKKRSIKKEDVDDDDSPFNEIYFYYFEQNLVQLLGQVHKMKIK